MLPLTCHQLRHGSPKYREDNTPESIGINWWPEIVVSIGQLEQEIDSKIARKESSEQGPGHSRAERTSERLEGEVCGCYGEEQEEDPRLTLVVLAALETMLELVAETSRFLSS